MDLRAGDRLAMLLPNEPEYLELIYACSWLGVIAVPVNARSSAAEIDRVLADASPRGLDLALVAAGADCAASMAAGAGQRAAGRCGRVLSGSNLRPGRDPGSHLHERHDRPPQRRCADPRQYSGQYRPSQLLDALPRRRCAPPRGAGFHILDFPFIFAAPAFGTCQITIPKFSAASFCETVCPANASAAPCWCRR